MLGKSRVVELSRQVFAAYLIFGLAAIIWLGIGLIHVLNAAIIARKEDALLIQLERTAAEASICYMRHEEVHLQSLVERVCREESLAYCAIVAGNRYQAHSSASQIGTMSIERAESKVVLGETERVRYVDAHARVLREYRTPLTVGEGLQASLRVAVPGPELAFDLLARSAYLPLAFFMPLGCIGFGALVLRRKMRPLSAVDAQLRSAATVPSMVDFRPQYVDVSGPASHGWNRMVMHFAEQQNADSSRGLADAVSQFREEQVNDVLNSLSGGLAIADMEGRITFANEAMVALLDRRAGDSLSGENFEDCLGSRWMLPTDGLFSDPETKQRVVSAEVKYTDLSNERTLLLTRHPIRSRHGGTGSGHVWSGRDISQQKLADKMRTEFLDTATHELRTPLTNIKAYSETLALAEITDVEQQKQFLNLINSEATRLARFVDDLLSISSIEVGSLVVNKQETNMLRMLDEVIGKAAPQMKQKEITFETSLPDKLPELRIDKDKTAATLTNLLGNAAKYTPEGGRVVFRVRHADDTLVIDVEDTGFGISEEDLPKVFEKFYRSADPRVQSEIGSGLGLSLAREVIRLQGGELTVQSELNKGTIFTVSLPTA